MLGSAEAKNKTHKLGLWEILAATYVQLADQSKKIDDTGNAYDPLDPTRTVWPSSST